MGFKVQGLGLRIWGVGFELKSTGCMLCRQAAGICKIAGVGFRGVKMLLICFRSPTEQKHLRCAVHVRIVILFDVKPGQKEQQWQVVGAFLALFLHASILKPKLQILEEKVAT